MTQKGVILKITKKTKTKIKWKIQTFLLEKTVSFSLVGGLTIE
jgi:hypothetical protein